MNKYSNLVYDKRFCQLRGGDNERLCACSSSVSKQKLKFCNTEKIELLA